jgi:hypothetical protein
MDTVTSYIIPFEHATINLDECALRRLQQKALDGTLTERDFKTISAICSALIKDLIEE